MWIIPVIAGVISLACLLVAINMLDRINKKLKSGEYEW